MKKIHRAVSALSLLTLFGLSTSATAQSIEALKLTKNLSEPTPAKINKEGEIGLSDETVEPAASTELEANLVLNKDLWNRIRTGYAIPDLENDRVTYQTTWYSGRVDYLKRSIQRGSRYLYHVVDALEKRGMPTDLALLPFIESAFNPQAVSSAKASGMWQFMAATGRDFNLKQNIFKDDRRGVLDSTEAALDYLQRLYGIFGDWQLALAAYNWGEGSVQRAIKKQQALGLPIDFDSLSARMPKETQNYVPKLQAVKNIIGNPAFFNLELPALENAPYFTSVRKDRDMDVNIAAKLAEIPISEFRALNPQFDRPVITAGNNTKILLPIENANLFETNFLNWKGPLSTWTTLNVQKTERVENLATRLGYKADLVREVNAIPAKMLVKAGSTILVPKSLKSSEDNIPTHVAEQAQLTIVKASPATHAVHIRVGRKENLASIAKRYKLDIADIKAWNKLHRDALKPGQTLVLQLPNKARGHAAHGSRQIAQHISHSRQKSTAQKSSARHIASQHKKPSKRV